MQQSKSFKSIKDPQTYQIIGVAMEVHKVLGCGFLEAVYQEAMEKELGKRKINYQREKEISVLYKGEKLNTYYKADFICFDDLIIELKAISKIGGTEEAQLINYLRALNMKRGLLINFGNKSLEYKRFANERSKS